MNDLNRFGRVTASDIAAMALHDPLISSNLGRMIPPQPRQVLSTSIAGAPTLSKDSNARVYIHLGNLGQISIASIQLQQAMSDGQSRNALNYPSGADPYAQLALL